MKSKIGGARVLCLSEAFQKELTEKKKHNDISKMEKNQYKTVEYACCNYTTENSASDCLLERVASVFFSSFFFLVSKYAINLLLKAKTRISLKQFSIE